MPTTLFLVQCDCGGCTWDWVAQGATSAFLFLNTGSTFYEVPPSVPPVQLVFGWLAAIRNPRDFNPRATVYPAPFVRDSPRMFATGKRALPPHIRLRRIGLREIAGTSALTTPIFLKKSNDFSSAPVKPAAPGKLGLRGHRFLMWHAHPRGLARTLRG